MKIGTIIDHQTALSAYTAAGHGYPTIPAGKNTVWHHFRDTDGNYCIIINQRGFQPTVTDDEQQLNGCSLFVAIDPSDAPVARATLEAHVREMLGLEKPEPLDAQLTVKLSKAELQDLRSLPRLTGDKGISALARRLLLQELSRIAGDPKVWTPDQDALLGTDSDAVIAGRLGKSRDQVLRRRKELGIPAGGKSGRPRE